MSSDIDIDGEFMAMNKIGASAGLTLRYEGNCVMAVGKERCARSKAACTSTAAASTLRLGANSRVMLVLPSVLTELIKLMPSMVENCFSRGNATDEAMVSGAAPGKEADTLMTGVLKLGRAATGMLA